VERGDETVGMPGRRQPGLVDRRQLMPGGPAPIESRTRSVIELRHATQASGPATTSGNRFRSEPLTRIRNE
jgi:hypothetical protein